MNPKRFFRSLLPGGDRPRRIWTGSMRGQYVVTSWRRYPRAILGNADAIERHEIRPIRGMASARAYCTDEGALEFIFVARLDAVWKSIAAGEDRVSGVKLDVGMQTNDALLGMAELLRRHRPKLVFEVPTAGNLGPLMQTLDDLGVDPSGTPIEGGSTTELTPGKSYAFSWRDDA